MVETGRDSRLSPLDHGDLIAGVVVIDFVHEGSDEQETTAAHPHDVGRIGRVRQAGGIEAGPLVANHVAGLFVRLTGRDVNGSVPVGGFTASLLDESVIAVIVPFE